MTTTTPSAVADLADRLAVALDVHDLVVIVDPAHGPRAYAHTDPCTGARRVTIGDHITAEGLDATAGALAHEIAHHHLGHTDRSHPWYKVHFIAASIVVGFIVAGAAVPVYAGLSIVVSVAALVVSVAALVVHRAAERGDEYAADAHAVQALNGLGLDGEAAVAAYLRQAPTLPWWYRAGGWLIHTHPTTSARLRRIRALNERTRPVLSHRTGS